MDDYNANLSHEDVPPLEIETKDEKMETEEIRDLREAVYQGNCSTLLKWPELYETYPGHLHINILPEFQRRGYGKLLINAFLEKLKSLEANGVHLGMVTANEVAPQFYKQLGFEPCPMVMDGGESGKEGVEGNATTLVKKL